MDIISKIKQFCKYYFIIICGFCPPWNPALYNCHHGAVVLTDSIPFYPPLQTMDQIMEGFTAPSC